MKKKANKLGLIMAAASVIGASGELSELDKAALRSADEVEYKKPGRSPDRFKKRKRMIARKSRQINRKKAKKGKRK